MSYILRTATAFILTCCFWRCAVQTTPTGGPKDEIPPVLVRSSPGEKETNFKGKTIELTFNEKVKLNNPTEEIIITPSPGKVIDFKAAKNKITIDPKDAWADNTTYSITFREGVQDITEGNSVDTLHLAFSTGPDIDSLSIYGRITNGIKEEIPQKITVAIYQADTIDISKHAAIYFTKTDGKGRFKIENLKAGKYFIYGFDDRNKNLKVESTTEVFGFRSSPITLQTNRQDSIIFSLAKADSRPIKINSIRRTDKTTRVVFNKSITSYQITSNTNANPINFFGDNPSEIIIYNPPATDSIRINLVAKDSIDLSFDTVFYTKQSTTKALAEAFKVIYDQPVYIPETGIFSFKGSFNKPIKQIDQDSIFIKIDSLNLIRIDQNDILIDNTNKLITLEKKIDKKKIPSTAKTSPSLILGKAFIITFENDSSQAEIKPIKISSSEKTATLEIEIKTTQKSFIVQLLSSSGTVLESVKNVKNHIFKNLEPVTYKLRVIVDKNTNGKWDTVNIFTRTEPEPVYYYKSMEGKSDIATRENSDIGPLVLTF